MKWTRLSLNEIPRSPDEPAATPPVAGSPPPSQPPASPPSITPPVSSRPEWVPEQFFDPQSGLKLDDFGKHYSELSKLKTDADARSAAIPAKPEDYKLELPQDFKLDGLPEGTKVKFNDQDPRVAQARALAKELEIPQEGFSRLLALEAQRIADETKAEDARYADERKKLGEKADERITSVDAFLKSALPAKQYTALQPVVTSADAIQAIETLITRINGSSIPVTPPGGEPTPPPKSHADRIWPSGFSTPQAKVG